MLKNGAETGVDCGGAASCARCATGQTCATGGDCQSGVCTGGTCQPPSCTDSVKNGSESAVDCGGPSCSRCAAGLGCTSSTDCQSGVCTAGICQSPTCADGVKNQTETDTDCGGVCGATCVTGQFCQVAGDCQSASCSGGTCQAQATELRIQYRHTRDTSPTDNWVRPDFIIANAGVSSVPMNELKIRYYFTIDSQQAELSACDYAFMGCGNVNRSFVALVPSRPSADYYLEVIFTTGAGSIPGAGNSGEMQLGFHKSDWSSYNENDDHSYDASNAGYHDWSKVTLYRNGVLVWGSEP